MKSDRAETNVSFDSRAQTTPRKLNLVVDRAGADSTFAGDEMHWLFDILFGSACIRA